MIKLFRSEQDTDFHSYQPPGCCRLIFAERNMDSEINEKLFWDTFSTTFVILQTSIVCKTLDQATLTVLRISTDLKFNEQHVIRHLKSYTYREKQEK